MCGITGWINFQQDLTAERETVEKMTETLAKRGPDDSNLWIQNHVAFGHRRLIVIDPIGGRQPMTKRKGASTYTICYNGELYNTEDVRKQLVKRGHRFRGHSDTEVLLTSYIEWKEDCLHHLNGIFAFAIWDGEREQLFLARDRLGVKPLFYSERGNDFLFGSEMKAILAHPKVKPIVGREGLAEIFALGPSRTPGHGVFEQIRELRPAHALTLSKEGKKVWRYWQVESDEHTETLEETVEHLRNLLNETIVRQLVSDVPVCTFLSGGVDSSAITAFSAEHFRREGKGRLHTFSIDYEGNDKYFSATEFQPNRDDSYIQLVSETFDTIHHRCVANHEQLTTLLHDALIARDVPGMADIDSSLLWFSREIKKDFVVSLSGECADEIFGGYPWFHRTHSQSENTFPWIRSLENRKQLLSQKWRKKLNLRDYVKVRYEQTVKETPLREGETEEETELRKLYYLNMVWFMSTLLDRKDRMSMATGLEVRVPFADHHLVQYAWNIPMSMKNVDGREKGILRRALEGILPPQVLYRKKSPYPKTFHPHYTKAVSNWLENILQDSNSPLYEFFDKLTLQQLAKTGGSAFQTPWFGQLMTGPQLLAYLIQIHLWLTTYGIEIVE
ncbi:asparagine synthase (glutamine-hydrolyzing) [Fervidibacillus albus]|uniref:asparagine synthase (glutamine-hydrolyzing) n=1 Tax=Fervidibacillus albus TaxID=2980026 RepID=A0A9E8RW81_9BACI|nr:asparagine synthase (glutamine-hydrolyzing) [Fervidibacillus albus]WAA10019.1 asparagine synthase (glutamine-hydrolyzing) [Fervidibacillus albus]